VARRLALLLVLATAVGVVAVVHAAASPRDDGDARALIAAARGAVTKYAFSGVVAIEWVAAGTTHRERVPVTEEGGLLVLGSSRRAMGTDSESLVHEANGWFGLSADGAPEAAPDPFDNYDISVAPGDAVAGRATTMVTAVSHADHAVQERLSFDNDTGILLQRVQLDGTRTERSVGFVEISRPVPATATTPPPTPPSTTHRATPLPPKHLGKGWDAPHSLGDGFQLLDAYRRSDGSMQLYYSDGLVGMSVFEEKGTLDTDALPHGGRTATVAGRRARVYETAGGRTVVWGTDKIVYTCVTDASARTMDALLGKLPAERSHGIVARVTHFVLGPFSWN
jgi:hypothetical protein